MFEILLGASARKAVTIPESGPGPKTLLKGNREAGFFGEVHQDLLFTPSEIVTALYSDKSVTYVNPAEQMWLKFIFKDKIIFTPKKHILTGLSWNDIYTAGAVYGQAGQGLYPGPTPTNQLTYLTKGSDLFKVRLFSGDITDPSAGANVQSMTATTTFNTAEFYQLIRGLINVTNKPANVPKWNIYTTTDISAPNNEWLIETSGTDINSARIAQAYGNTLNVMGKTNTSTSNQYRPVLELVLTDDLMEIQYLNGISNTPIPASIDQLAIEDDQLYLPYRGYQSGMSIAPAIVTSEVVE